MKLMGCSSSVGGVNTVWVTFSMVSHNLFQVCNSGERKLGGRRRKNVASTVK